jgi:histidinol dehydrogenase
LPDPLVWFSGPLSILGEERKKALLNRGRRALAEGRVQVTPIMYDVRDNGDDALRRLTKRLDGVEVEKLALEKWDWKKQAAKAPKDEVKALEAMARRIRAYHEKQRAKGYETTVDGVAMGLNVYPLERVGLYVPGGTACYPSTLLMGAIPAKVAGVEEVIACTPPRSDGGFHTLMLAAADIAGVDELYRVGGAQAIFAMAFGTKTIKPVQKIVGPGNVYVQAAKQLAQGHVGIDMLAGPSEVLVIADDTAPPELVAWELAAQAEHDRHAVSVLVAVGDSARTAAELALEELLPKLDRAEVVRAALTGQAALVSARTLDEALAFADEFAPEHLVLMVKDPKAALGKVRHAGSVFLGQNSPVALGDYGAGTNHILPTSGNARFGSGLGVLDFLHAVQWQHVSPSALAKIAPDVERLATLEGLTAHAGATAARLEKGKKKGRK